ncbi:MAG: Gfo/Idh/MocA family protein [Planctomycetota bacterium]
MISLRVGLSGAGPAGVDIVEQVRIHEHCDVVAVHDARPGLAAELARGCDLGIATEDFAELLGTGVDFVVLAGPLQDRIAQVQACVEQSVPVLLHAPMAADLTTARQIHELGEQHGVRIGVYVRAQGDPVVEQLRRMIAADWLGGVVCVQAITGDDELLRTGRVSSRDNLFVTHASQQLHLTSWLTGRTVHSVTAQTTGSFSPGVDDGGVATLMLRGNVSCSYLVSRLTRADAFAIHGTDGGLRIAGDRIWLSGQHPFKGHVFDYLTPGIEQVLSRADLQKALQTHRKTSELHGRFARWLEDTDDFPCPSEQAVLDFEGIAAMRLAAEEQRTVDL